MSQESPFSPRTQTASSATKLLQSSSLGNGFSIVVRTSCRANSISGCGCGLTADDAAAREEEEEGRGARERKLTEFGNHHIVIEACCKNDLLPSSRAQTVEPPSLARRETFTLLCLAELTIQSPPPLLLLTQQWQ